MRNVLLALCLVAAYSASLRADLKYTTHMEIKKSDAIPAQPANPMMAMMGDAVMKQMVPEGAADIVYLVSEKGARIEYLQAAMGQVAGAVNIIMPDGTLIVMNPTEKTYWKTSVQAALDSMKSAGIPTSASKIAVALAGRSRKIMSLPWRKISTCSEVNRNSFGKRTAWLLPDWKTRA